MAKSIAARTADSEEPGAEKKLGFFGRIFQFLREVIAELKKVTTPTGKELVQYVIIVLFFVTFMMLFISGLDYVFGQGAFWIFGNGIS
ncbi:preprotein translocase subunit SecE [Rothia nasimurium]|uniref:Protein translocase subunit SecE n=1 Tax=Rothia nasimurium TaxID=85336 RepID=A0A4Y9F3N5_9MICC|nr:preprotein translocase subunit SecE [Rothia nasimurium]MBF0808155.1 preprotein translocase subunit SecE [Rothia nasimurium]TFU22431.1 preprotein translocase subunit SecE [Rothia nasimurium]